MDRTLMSQLIAWKDKPRRKPLILNGVRQSGKTWLLKEFGKRFFENVAYINFDNNASMRDFFEGDYNIERLIAGLQVESGETISHQTTLICFDEVQDVPKALTSLKYFNENAPEYAIAAAGSLLGVALHKGDSFPVGKVETLDVYPLSFDEFLQATGNAALSELLKSGDLTSITAFKSRYITLLKQYYFVGGMPEAVSAFIKGSDFERAREIQNNILRDYERDFSKHLPPRIAERALDVWDSIPSHLGQENKKFVFGRIRPGSRAKDYEAAIGWLVKAGLIHKVPRVTKPDVPLRSYVDHSSFKAYLGDIGLLGALSDLGVHSVVEGTSLFEEFKGALTEQFVCQELAASGKMKPYYWSAANSRGEIDFIVQQGKNVYPIEVKAEENLRAKSLRSFKNSHPEVNARRFSLSDYREEDWLINIPLYLVGSPQKWL